MGHSPRDARHPLDLSSVPGRGSPGSQIQPPRAALRREALPVRHTTSLAGRDIGWLPCPSCAASRPCSRPRRAPLARRPGGRLRPAARRRARPRRGRLGLGALRGRPGPGQGPAGSCCWRAVRASGASQWLGLMLTSKDHDRDVERGGALGSVLDGRRLRRLGPRGPTQRGTARPAARPRRLPPSDARVPRSIVGSSRPSWPRPGSTTPCRRTAYDFVVVPDR